MRTPGGVPQWVIGRQQFRVCSGTLPGRVASEQCGKHRRSVPSRDAVIFDNDGLLLDTEEAWTRAEETLFARRGRVFTLDHKRSLIGSARAAAAKKLEVMLELGGEGEALMDELHGLVMEEALAGVEPRPGALELLERLLAAGVPVAVASNSQREFVERTLADAGLLDGRFSAVVSVEDVEHPKPAPDIYLEACRRLGAEPGMCTALEDSPTGVAAAVAAGMYVIGVPYFAGAQLPECDLLADSLAHPTVRRALGLG
jgi:HAD superfamily hydrolase (TIGR01509 family)